jgi:hypothetical protein
VRRRWFALPVVAALAAAPFLVKGAEPVEASHAWSNYHWGRTSNPFTLKVGDNLTTAEYRDYLRVAAADWARSTMLDTSVVAGQATNPGRDCGPTAGRIEVCNGRYGENGWLGVAQVWLAWSGKGWTHISQAITKLNDSYAMDAPTKQYVVCQEVGHDFGLDHQDENHYNRNLGSCMDYTAQPAGGGTYGPDNLNPNQHDLDQLVSIYAITRKHRDTSSTVDGSAASSPAPMPGNRPADWGTAVKARPDGRPILYRRAFGRDHLVYTWVIWADQIGHRGP